MAAARGGPLDSGAMINSSRSTIGGDNDALKKALEKSGLNDNKIKYKKGSGKLKSKKKKRGAGFNFSLDADKSSSPEISFQEDQKEYNYRNNDITTDEGVPIWKIISKRYNLSGLRRLFNDDDKE